MKNKLILGFGIVLILFMMVGVRGEMTLWSDIVIDEDNSAVAHHSYYQYYDDIEASDTFESIFIELKKSLLAGRTNNVYLWAIIEPMPYDAGNFTINYCDYNVTHIKNDYDNDGNLINVTEVDYGFTYPSLVSANTTYLYLKLKNRDSLVTDIRCFYNDSDYLYDQNFLGGRGGIYLPANKCGDCEEYTLEELSDEIERTDEIIIEKTRIYNLIQSVMDFNFQIWLYVYWIIKLTLFLAGIGLLFYGVYHLYLFIRDIERKI